MFENLKTKLVLGILLTNKILINNFAHAQNVDTDTLLPIPTKSEILDAGKTELEAIQNLPEVSLEGASATAIKTILGWSFILSLIALVVAGIYMIAFEGDDEKITKAKSIIVYLIFGIIVISIAYGIVTGVVQMKFFK